MPNTGTPYSFPKSFCFCSVRRLYRPLSSLTYLQDVWKKLPWLLWNFLLSWNCLILLPYRFTLVAFAVILCFSTSITKGNPFFSTYASDLATLSLWSYPFSIVQQTMLLFYWDLLLICWYYSNFPFPEWSLFYFVFDSFMPISSPTSLKITCITFLHCVMSMIFTCSNTLFIPIASSFSFSLPLYFRLISLLSRSLYYNACLTLWGLFFKFATLI